MTTEKKSLHRCIDRVGREDARCCRDLIIVLWKEVGLPGQRENDEAWSLLRRINEANLVQIRLLHAHSALQIR